MNDISVGNIERRAQEADARLLATDQNNQNQIAIDTGIEQVRALYAIARCLAGIENSLSYITEHLESVGRGI